MSPTVAKRDRGTGRDGRRGAHGRYRGAARPRKNEDRAAHDEPLKGAAVYTNARIVDPSRGIDETGSLDRARRQNR
jgi:hypothetical protein